jgi:hypothetical protein
MSGGMKSTHSLQIMTRLITATPDGGAGAGEDGNDDDTEEQRVGAIVPLSLVEPTSPRSPDATKSLTRPLQRSITGRGMSSYRCW